LRFFVLFFAQSLHDYYFLYFFQMQF